jgi:hypothetical protein
MSAATKRDIAYGRIFWTGAGIILSGIASWWFAGRLDNAPDILVIIATVFSILAAALIAIISILGDPSMLIDPSWRKNTLKAQETQRKLHRKTDIFVLYVITLGLLLAFALTKRGEWAFPWLQFATFFFSALGFWESLTLPHSLKEIQRKRLQDAIDAMKPAG